ncbi:Protease synthase and sporulation protein [Wickerhamomyces ciferrii]|uniref:Protease synthase and sporulation protein n=1 Tax=Wickerhamomyces ciferrii (strain ATCC 14091 / BCRC 22168 / CBS 111 / JCM 3599 / NBRC 0793 / NRRL Y-1031 F-60-10) TaxID=1206466 RepID=K0KPW9_WICCF|nr:Protease synthase and sporulation protein [Wickerhamomyces ciferrii]CCH43223.1 Protease synthase and sporulation protein [Wickerhamomyces ciferrii]
MYIPNQFKVDDEDKQLQLIKEFPLAALIFVEKSFFGTPNYSISHIPFFLTKNYNGQNVLKAHLARGNELVPLLQNANHNCLVSFRSTDSYISPSWYPTKEKTHKFVPTWDFGAVNAYGIPQIIEDKEWLLQLLNEITDQEEGKRPEGSEFKPKWKVDQAPENYLDTMIKNIVGLEIVIDELEGKFKFNQNKAPIDTKGVIDAHINEVGGSKGEYMAKLTTQEYPKEL